jgi:hypothetical protein
MHYSLNDLTQKPFKVPVGTIINYYAGSNSYHYVVAEAFLSDADNIVIYSDTRKIPCQGPALYLEIDGTHEIFLDFPNVEFKPGDIIYNQNNRKFIVADEESCSRNLTEVHCRIEGENGLYLIPRGHLSFEPNTVKESIPGDNTGNPQLRTKTILFKDQETLDEIEFFPSTPTPEQFKAMLDLSEVSRGLHEEPNFKQVDFSEELADLRFNQEKYFNGFFSKLIDKPNSAGGIKFDSKKARPTLLLKSMPDAVQEVIDVLELGARKYAPDNWKKVENARYEDAELRHKLARFSGEKYDPETKKYHLAHEICNLMFLLQKEMEGLD